MSINHKIRFIHEFQFDLQHTNNQSLLAAFEEAERRGEIGLCNRAKAFLTKGTSKISWKTGAVGVGFIQCIGFGAIAEHFSINEITDFIRSWGYEHCTVQFAYELALHREHWLKIIPSSEVIGFNAFYVGMPLMNPEGLGCTYPQSLAVLSNTIALETRPQYPSLHMMDTEEDKRLSAYDIVAVQQHVSK